MKRIAIVLLLVSGFAVSKASAQGKPFDYINVGVGVSNWGIPVFAGIDFQVDDQITVGGQLNYRRYREGLLLSGFGTRWVHNIFEISANGNYHFFDPGEEYDVYAGLSVGYYIWSTRRVDDLTGVSAEYVGDGIGGLGLRLQVGGRYAISDDIILYGEIGGGNRISGARVGVSFPF